MEIKAKSNSRANAKSAEFAVIRVIIGVKLHEKGQLPFWVAQNGAIFGFLQV